jgi:uncharacterized protein (TIGR03435 family)
MRSALLAVWIAGVTVGLSAQDQAPPSAPASSDEPRFEVASVKKTGPDQPMLGRFGMMPNGRFNVPGMPLSSLITMAYGIQRFQLVGGPGWINSDRFDINAVSDGPFQPTPPGTPNRMQLMLRTLLKERFALKAHNETRELPLSYLVMAREDQKLGERMRPSTVDCVALAKARAGGPPPTPPKPGEVPQCGAMMGMGRIVAGSIPMSALASMLANMLNRPVYDRTGLTGNFEIQLEYTPDQMPQIPPGATLPPGLTLPSPDGPSLNTALQEQLGLKLEATRGSVEVLVIDSVEQPTPD